MIELSEEIKLRFQEEAKKDFPRESCAIVSVIKGKQQLFICKNISQSDSDFILCPDDFIKAEEFTEQYAGDMVAVLHSHPVSSSEPTPADLVGCENSGLQWSIFSIKYNSWKSFAPSGYKAPLIGRKFKHGVFDCYSAVRDWYEQNKSITLRDFDRNPLWWEKGENTILENMEKAGFTEEKGDPQIGDVFLINFCSPVVNHCAVYIGNGQIFHQTMNRLSGREIYGGWIKKNTRMMVRYRK